MEIIIGVAAKVAEYTVAPIARPLINLWKYKSNLENLKKEVEKLEARRDSVQCLIKVGEEPLPHVKKWQDNVNSIINEVSGLVSEDNPEQQNMQCCKGFTCPQLKKCYQRRNNVPRKLKDVAQLLQEGREFKKVSHRSIPEMNQPRKESEVSESRMSISKDIIAALSNSDVNIVGIYGMGGVGKTTLAKEVETQAMQDKLFNKIVFVEVSQSPDIKTIQGVIADYLGLQFIEESVPGRARKLCEVLKNEAKILLILDNIWGSINFEEVGIPSKNDSKELKLLLTTRSLDVLMKEMDSQRNFHVEALCEAEAWSLFKSKAGTCVDHPHLKSVAHEVANKCGGMPVAIVTIAKALKNTQAEVEWLDALRRLNNLSSESVDGITKEVSNSIKLSYDYLDEELKEIFLLCSRMGRTYDAFIRDLFRYGLGLGLFKTFNSLEEALCNVYASINKLKANSLLLDAPKSEYAIFDAHSSEKFAMHDVVCAIARSIAFKDQNVFNVTDIAIPSHLTNGYSLRICTSITLHNIGELPNDLELVCPQLKFLYVKPKQSSLKIPSYISFKIPNGFFTGMLGLHVLHVIDTDLSSLPTSLSGVVNLQTICLEQCRLEHIGAIGDLKNLEILSFRGSHVKKLPEEMCRLTKLRLLDLTNCSTLSVIPPKVLSSFKKLEALYMASPLFNWNVEKSNNERRNNCLDELEIITSLEIKVPDAAVSRGLISPRLKRYHIIIGEHWSFNNTKMPHGWDIPFKTSRFLTVKLNTNEDGVISQLRGVRELTLDEVPGIANILYDLDREGFPELEYLSVKHNSHILYIVDIVSHNDAFPSLKSLVLWDLINLKKLWNGPLEMESFHQLKTLRVGKCNKLIDIFSFITDRAFQELEEIEVRNCENIEEILTIGDQVHEIKLSKLRILKLKTLPRLKTLCCNVNTTSRVLQLTSDTKAGEIISEEEEHEIPTPLFNNKVALPGLETLDIENINVEMIWNNQLSTMSFVQTLTCLIVSNFSKLRRLWSESYIEFPSLKEMKIRNCPKLEFIIDNKVAFPKLETLEIENINVEMIWDNQLSTMSFIQTLTYLIVSNLSKLKRLWFENYIEFPSLKEVKIQSCPKLEFIFNNKVEVTSLEKMQIIEMDNLKMIWCNQPVQDSFSKLKSLEVKKCQKLLTMFLLNTCGMISSLDSLNVEECKSLEEIFDLQGIHFEERHSITATQAREYQNLSFANLKKLKLFDCQSLKSLFSALIIAKEGVVMGEMPAIARFIFPKLTSLELYELPELKSFYSGRHKMEWPILNTLEMHQCGIHGMKENEGMQKAIMLQEQVCRRMLGTSDGLEVHVKKIWPNLLSTMFSWVQNLTKLSVYDCGNLKELFPSSLVELGEKEMRNTISFPKLSYLVMDRLKSLTRLCSGYYIDFPSLKEFKISNCPKLKAYIFDDKVGVSSLKKIEVVDMDNLEMIWENKLVEDSFSKLKSLQVMICHKLLTLFPSNICGRISSLESLIVKECRSLVEIFDFQEINSKEGPFIAATQIGECFIDYPQITLSFVNLILLEVTGCQSLKNLFPASIVAKEGVAAKKATVTTNFVFPKLTSLALYKLPELRTIYPGKYTVEVPVLRSLNLHACGIYDTNNNRQMQKHLFLLVEKAFPCLDKLALAGNDLTMMWQEQDTKCLFKKFKFLKIIGLFNEYEFCLDNQTVFYYLGDVKYMWKKNFKLDLVLANFEDITVRGCDSFFSLMPPSATFQNLTSLAVDCCNSLEHIVTFSVAKSLVNLIKMRISNCKMITEVVGDQGDVIEDKIIFSNLKSLEFVGLPRLTSFCSLEIALEFLSLEDLSVNHCPNLKIFSQRDLTTPRSLKVMVDGKLVNICPDVDLKTTIQQFHEKEGDESDSSSHHVE